MREADWVSAHLFSAGDLDALLIDAVRPLTTDLVAEGAADGYFYLRHWDGGPHIRLRLLVPDEGHHGPIRERVALHCGRYLRDHPSTRRLTPQAYADMAEQLARRERARSHLPSPLPNDSVQFIAYRREYERFGAEEAMRAVERHFMESSRLAMALLGARASADQRRVAALAMILIAWLTGERGTSGPGDWTGLAPADLDARYLRQRDKLLLLADLARKLVAGQPTGVPPGSLDAWLRSIRALRDALTGPAADRVADTCAHLMSNRLGLTLDDEGGLRYLAARAVTELGVAR